MKQVISEHSASSDVLHRILEKITDGFFVVDRDWKILLANEPAAKIAQLPLSTIVGKNLWDVVPHYKGTDIYQHYVDAMDTGVPKTFLTHLEDFDIWVETRLFPSEMGLTSYFRDITEHVVAEATLRKTLQSLERTTKELSRSNHDLSQFALISSHDLKEPLKSIALWIDLAIRDKESSAQENYLLRASENVRKCISLVESLLEYSNIGTGDIVVAEVSINQVLKNIVQNLGQAIEECGAIIEWGNLPVVVANQIYMSRIFQNLVSNSIKYRHPDRNPIIRITSEEFWDRFVFSISDNGIGIGKANSSQVFQLFQRAPNSGGVQGNGIGLATVKRLIELHGGAIELNSEVGVGSTFRFWIPKMNLKDSQFGFKGVIK